MKLCPGLPRTITKTEVGAQPRSMYADITKPPPAELRQIHTDVPADWNPLLEEVNGLPRFDAVRSEHLVSGMYMTIDQFGADLEKLQISLNVSAARPWRLTWEKFASPMEQILDRIDRVWGAICLLRDVNETSLDTHRAHHELLPLIIEISQILAESDDVYRALHLLSLDKRLNGVQRRILEKHMRDAWHGGIGIQNADAAKRFHKSQQELAYLGALFLTNVKEDEQRVVMLIDSTMSPLAELSESTKASLASAAKANGHLQASSTAGPWLLTAAPSVVKPVLELSEDRNLRRELFIAQAHRAWRNSSGNVLITGDNKWIIKRMLTLRHDWAAELGYGSYADMVFSSRMASLQQVESLLDKLKDVSLQAARSEMNEIRSFAQNNGQETDIQEWDVPFWRARLFREHLGWSQHELRQYFALPNVLEGLFDLVGSLFNVDIVPADGEAPVWHPSVQFLYLVDRASRVPIAAFYLDVYRSPRNARSGFWADVNLRYSEQLGVHGTPRRPVAHIVGGVEPPALKGTPALLTFDEVQDLFCAMGSALQELLVEQPEGLAAGTRGMELDAVGFPRMFLGLWVYDKSTLRSIARHHETGETLPDEVIDKLAQSQSFFGGMSLLEEVRLAKIDLQLHTNITVTEDNDIWQLVSSIETELSVGDTSYGAVKLCSFLEPFSTGNAAGYYAKLWSQVLAADAFEAFQEDLADQSTGIAKQEQGLKFRREILAPGSGRAPVEAFRDFRGRIPRVAALLRRYGLPKQTNKEGTP